MGEQFAPIGVEAIVQGFQQFMGELEAMGVQYDKTTDRFRAANGRFVSSSQVADKAMRTLLKTLLEFSQKQEEAGGTGDEAGKKVGAFGKLLQTMTGNATRAAGGVGTLISAIGGPAGLVVGIGAGVIAAKTFGAVLRKVTDTIRGVASSILQATLTAGRFEELEFTALALGRAMGKGEREIRSSIESINDLGIRYDIAAQTVAQFTRNQIDLAKSTELVRIAQALAVIAGEDSSQTMQRLTLAIATNNTRRLRFLGITTTANAAQEAFAKANGRSVDSLTELEKRTALTNAIIEDGARLLDVYDAAMQSPTKQLRSLSGRELPELAAAFGAFFTPALGTGIKTLRDLVSALTDAMQEGGFLFDLMVQFGALAGIWADLFSELGGLVVDFFSNLSKVSATIVDDASKTGADFTGNLGKSMNEGMGGIVTSMLEWGVEIVASLAEGMISAASTILVSAMNAISNVLMFWLAPGSPPRIAPNIDEWGTSAMAEFLRGFTKADFSVLEAIQAPLKKVLSGPEFAEISKALIGAIGAGDIGAGLFQRIAKSAGQFGQEVAILARLQVELAAATNDVQQAEERLAASRKQVSEEQANVNNLVRQFNRDLRQGAKFTEEERQARLQQIDTAEAGLEVASQQAAEAEKALDAAKAEEKRLKEQADLQKKVLDQLMAIDEAMKDVESSSGGAAKGARGLGKAVSGIAAALPDPAQFDISSRIGDAIEEAKNTIKRRWFGKFGIFRPIIDSLENLQEPLDTFKSTFSSTIDIVARSGLKLLFLPVTLGREWLRGFTIIKGAFAGFVRDWLKGIGVVIDSIIAIGESLGIPTTGLQTFRNDVITPLIGEFGGVAKSADTAREQTVDFGNKAPTDKVNAFRKNAVSPLASSFAAVKKNAEDAKKKAGEFGTDLPTKEVQSFTDNAIVPLVKGLEGVSKTAENAKGALSDVGKAAKGQDFSDWDPFTARSPAPLEKGFRGITRAIREFSSVGVPRLTGATGQVGVSTLAPVAPSAPSLTNNAPTTISNQRSLEINFGPVTIAGEMDLQRTQAAISQTVREELQRST